MCLIKNRLYLDRNMKTEFCVHYCDIYVIICSNLDDNDDRRKQYGKKQKEICKRNYTNG